MTRNAAMPATMAITTMRGIQRVNTAFILRHPCEARLSPALHYVSRGQRYVEACFRAFTRGRFERDITTVSASDPSREREPEAHAAGLARATAIGAPERCERALELRGRHADAAIGDLERDVRAVRSHGERD